MKIDKLKELSVAEMKDAQFAKCKQSLSMQTEGEI